MTDIRKLIDLFEDPVTKKQVIDLVKNTDDEGLLQKVLKTLKAGNIEERISSVVSRDPDGSRFVHEIARVIVSMDFPVEDKDAFLKKFPTGIVNVNKLLSGSPQTFLSLVDDSEFAKALFKILTTVLVSQGVGPGEVALAVMSPKIQWSGRLAGGGDIMVGKRAIEVKTSAIKGGRWINPRKAKMDLAGVASDIMVATGLTELPDRINAQTWCYDILPKVDPKKVKVLTTSIAAKTFNYVDSKNYARALASGDPAAIIDEQLRTGYENYKAYSNFEGILLMDVKSESSQYFKDYDAMKGKIHIATMYIYAPEGEIMPQVRLLPDGGGGSKGSVAKSAAVPSAPVAQPKAARASLGADRISRPGKTAAPSVPKSGGTRAERT